ncbi:DNA mismatch repair endonuclease MutL [Wansuia hejianensis]|uniref:DNA mismatch repair protein MutL n=1 Tax=Wansuia hejianensis TaxID=2763667 RepID=A0A926EVB6_9FIRM|nr:DNA mismatch repair endonuclease MutL [Wansuia hejianensis]MBC8590538.1 DNA mismatch repair endonuclease MutL [Wansuia hejianensis]
MGKIKVLDNMTIQKIAAGEVIENPASIVKELVENSLDANAENIVIEINNGGKSYIRITDDGDGIPKDDVSIAFKRHSTSKLNNINDIYSIMSLGFRGEALASISTVSKMEILTKTSGSEAGVHSHIEEGEVISSDIVGCPKGTTMIVKDLFYNLPVRKKFLKSDISEGNQINDIITKLVLGNYEKSIKFIRDGKTILHTSKNKDLLDTIYTVLGKDFANNLIQIDYKDSYIRINGFISNNNLYRGNRGHQYMYINGRSIVNSAISKSIENKYKSLIPINRFPIFVLNIDIAPGEIDVNIHPTKQEVKFINKDRVIGTITNCIERYLLSSCSIPQISMNKDNQKDAKSELPKLYNLNDNDLDKASNITDEIVVRDFITNGYNEIENLEIGNNLDFKFSNNENKENLIESYKLINESDKNFKSNDPNSDNINDEILIEEQTIQDQLLDINPIGRIFNTYIIAESKDEEKIFFIDQHAAHERIMYEKFKKEYEEESITVQQLIVPEIIELTNSEMNKLLDNIKIFIKLGFDLEEFGSNCIALRGVPLVFGNPKGRELFLDILDNIDFEVKSSYDLKVEKIMKISCTKAIKSGDKITDSEILALLKDLRSCKNPYTCPHGRPTVIEMSKNDIEKEFLRII